MPRTRSAMTVLVVDDEPVVLSVVTACLAHHGYHVLSANSGQAALDAAIQWKEPIALVLCDVLMPGMHGPDFAERLQLIHSESAVLFMAGFPGHPVVMERVLAAGLPFLPKPFLPGILISKIRETLASLPSWSAAGA